MVKKNHHCGGPMPDDITCRLNVNSDTRVYSIGFPICTFIILHIFQKYNPYILCFAPLITLPIINKRREHRRYYRYRADLKTRTWPWFSYCESYSNRCCPPCCPPLNRKNRPHKNQGFHGNGYLLRSGIRYDSLGYKLRPTRNQLGRKVSWVRIPPAPPNQKRTDKPFMELISAFFL